MTPARSCCLVILTLIGAAWGDDAAATTDAHRCGAQAEVALQVLGSGGPELVGGRAGTAYVVWHAGRARVLVDLGPGAMLRFGEAGANLEDLAVVALSHLHVDHSGDLPALVKTGYFSARDAALPVVGPAGDDLFPPLRAWLTALLDDDRGAYGYLAGALDGTEGQFALVPRQVPLTPVMATTVHDADGLRVDAMPVPHGVVPSLAFRVTIAGRTLVFGGDQNGTSAPFWEFARQADVLVAHLAVPENVGGPARHLHATPSVLADGAARAGVRRLVLSHLMTRSEAQLDASLGAMRKRYAGPIEVAHDLLCIAMPARGPAVQP